MDNIRFDTSTEDERLIVAIVDRYTTRAEELGVAELMDGVGLEMDLTATHCNGCPLRLKELLEADEFNFAHDIGGITKHLDRTTGKLMNHFLPRFADTSEAA